MNLFNLVDLNKMGDFDEKWGQAYWGKTDDDRNIKFNSMNQDIIAPCTISAEETTSKTSSKGTAYLQLKKVKVAESASVDAVATSPAPTKENTSVPAHAQLDRIEEQLQEVNSKLDKLMGVDGSFIPDEEL